MVTEQLFASPTAALRQTMTSAGMMTALLRATGRALSSAPGSRARRTATLSCLRAMEAALFQSESLQQLATDHASIILDAFTRLDEMIDAEDVEMQASVLAILVNITNENASACRIAGNDTNRLFTGMSKNCRSFLLFFANIF